MEGEPARKEVHAMTVPILAAFVIAAMPIQSSYPVQVAPFTDSQPAREVMKLSAETVPTVVGTEGPGVSPKVAVHVSGLRLNPVEGLIHVWIRPRWNGNDGLRHRLLATEKAGGRQLVVEKSPNGLLRAELTTPTGMTVARADVSHWRAGEWHQVVVGWVSHNGRHVGLPLWVDRWAKDGPVTPHGVWDEAHMPSYLVLGDESAEADFDELIIRPDLKAEGPAGMVACIYRDYFRTAPYTDIKIDLEPARVPSDRRAVAGCEKQFGLLGKRGETWEPMVENVVRYTQWAYFDAKPLIKWETSNSQIATVDANGRLKALKEGTCTLTATFRGRTARYRLEVISPERPDLAAICIELHPRYRNDAVKNRIAPGEETTARVRLGNFGMVPAAPGTVVRFSLIPDRIRNYRLDTSEKPVNVWSTRLEQPLGQGEETVVEFRFPFPAVSTWMQVELDPSDLVREVCEVNNVITELTDARPVQFGVDPKVLKACLTERKLNHVGSFCYYDWIRAQKLRMDVMLREAVYPTTGPHGVEEAYRIDAFTAYVTEGPDWDKEPYRAQEVYFDGGFPINEPVDLMAVDCAIIHEFGHTILCQPDLYGYPVSAENVFITDETGQRVAGTPQLPVVRGRDTLPASPGVNVPCYVGYPSLMDGCQLWLEPSQAGHIMFFKGYRGERFWGTQGRLIPLRANWLLITDAHDQPLKGAAVYIYHVSQAPVQDSGAKYFADLPKFIGHTDAEGRFVFPTVTDEDWDDPETDEVDGARPVWNPFGTVAKETAFTPNVWEVQGLLLIRVVSGTQSEYHFMDLTQFNAAFLSGQQVYGIYTLRTSLPPAVTPTPAVRRPAWKIPGRINKAPVAIAPERLTVRCGEEFVIDGSASFDPEGQPLMYRWSTGEGWLAGTLSNEAVLKLKAPDEPKELVYKLWVLDGVRASQPVYVRVQVVKP